MNENKQLRHREVKLLGHSHTASGRAWLRHQVQQVLKICSVFAAAEMSTVGERSWGEGVS